MTATEITKPVVQIADLSRHADGFWVATMDIDGERVEAANAFGSWAVRTDPSDTHNDPKAVRREVVSPYTLMLAKALRQRLDADTKVAAA
jgi:hypothetical protein